MSLYTKYRPQDFDNLVGQNFIKETLKKAICEEKTVGAYLFCGPRGTGKTSTARIFAKAINCLNPHEGNPCLECEVCKEFAEEKLIDIIEIDAASHTGVDNIREIIEKAQFAPTKTKFKVYIIDEVHMLSKGAFNALLKILEEPPKHVKFILATTETHKVPETIISRCQRYDFKRIDNDSIRERLLFIAKSEDIKIDEDSLNYIISSSNGGLRNAISLFEQLIEDKEINYQKIVEKLGISSLEERQNFIEKLKNKDLSIIDDFDKIIDSGKNLKLFFKELIFSVKDRIISDLKNKKEISDLINIFEILDETYAKTKYSLDENTTFLVGILKIIGNYKNTEIIEKIPTKNISKKEEKIENPVKKIEKEELKEEDLNDIFGEIDFSESKLKNTEKLEKSNGNFDLEKFILEVKQNGGKGALTMSLRGIIFSLEEQILRFEPKTKMARLNLENADNRVVMLKSLEDLGFKDFKIIIE
ncbi:DNA polymerase III, subunit gamma and tau [Candidatus Gracilibacteria bacterium GN02-872]|nr:DNA polymerase III, subunit gamma and tau [Candidatus Gracilibacteria bacterium GN02-872]